MGSSFFSSSSISSSIPEAMAAADAYITRIYSTAPGGAGATVNPAYEGYVYDWAKQIGSSPKLWHTLSTFGLVYLGWPDTQPYTGFTPPSTIPFFPYNTLPDVDPTDLIGDCLRGINSPSYSSTDGWLGNGIDSYWYLPMYGKIFPTYSAPSCLMRVCSLTGTNNVQFGEQTTSAVRLRLYNSGSLTTMVHQINSANLASTTSNATLIPCTYAWGWINDETTAATLPNNMYGNTLANRLFTYNSANNYSAYYNYNTYTTYNGFGSLVNALPLNARDVTSIATFGLYWTNDPQGGGAPLVMGDQGVGYLIITDTLSTDLQLLGTATDELNNNFGRL